MGTDSKNLYELINLIKYPSLTEKSINLYGNRQYTFIVDKNLTKPEIKFILENLFNISIVNISTCILPPRRKRVGKFIGQRSTYKKAFIKLKEGDSIAELFN